MAAHKLEFSHNISIPLLLTGDTGENTDEYSESQDRCLKYYLSWKNTRITHKSL